MKTLLLLRHAKSSWSNPSLADIDRPLNKRGKRDAPRIGALLREEDLIPDIIISSPALRARNTAKAVTEASGYEGKIEINEDYYPGDTDSFIESFYSLEAGIDSVMIVAHNPGLEEFLNDLTGESAHLPTSALAQVTLLIDDWFELEEGAVGKLINIWRVKEMP